MYRDRSKTDGTAVQQLQGLKRKQKGKNMDTQVNEMTQEEFIEYIRTMDSDTIISVTVEKEESDERE